MERIKKLDPAQLYQRTDPEQLDFDTTADLEKLTEIIGQSRAVDAMQFGVGIEREGYNIFALGPSGTGKESVIRQHFEKRASEKPTPPDWCYVNNFEDSHKPRAIQLPAGKGVIFRKDMEKLVEEIQTALSAAFESEEYQARRQAIMEEFKEKQAAAFEELQEAAEERGVTLLRTPSGLVIAPVRDGEVLSSEEVQELSEEEQAKLQSKVEELQGELQKIIRQVPAWQRETQEKLNELNQEVASFAIAGLIDELREKYSDLDEILEYLDEVQEDVVENAQNFLPNGQEGANIAQMLSGEGGGGGGGRRREDAQLRRYAVNVLVDHSDTEGAPVVYEDNPTYQNLIGRVEHMARMGALLTDFQLIKPGALHRASGGYLILDARKVLTQPYAWEALKRVLQAGQIRIESVGQMLSLISTVSLEPEPIPLDVKIALFGERMLYYLLWQLDPDFAELFKVEADFETEMDRTDSNQKLYAQLIATLVQKKDLRPFDRSAVVRVIERSARLAGDREKLTMRTRNIIDLLEEADYWAGENGNGTVTDGDVQQAIEAQIHRADRVRERVQEAILRDTFLIDTQGEVVGQINGLSVLQLGNFAFGRPTRITARTRLGKGQVLDIEREVELGGPIHSKGVLILSGFLGGRYTSDRPLSLSASLVFEQSYGGVEGDSASSAELYALLSAIADLPLRQSLAVTGSVNQRGQVQAIGGVNEKIEGFFDVCQARGLTGEQGVLIPASNVKHLMLRQDVVEAVEEGQFHVYPVETVDQGIEILTGVEAGEQDEEGTYPEGSVNDRVAKRLAELAEKRQAFSKSGEEKIE
jgi:lon-related putative ATP-dependent protease